MLYVAAALEKDGHAAEILDGQVHLAAHVWRDSEGRIHLGISWVDFETRVKGRQPDVVGIISGNFALGFRRNYYVNLGLSVSKPLPGTNVEKIFLERGLMKNFARNFASYVARNPVSAPALLRGDHAASTRKRWIETLLDVYLCKNFIGELGRTAAR
jgi:hypothetical protein